MQTQDYRVVINVDSSNAMAGLLDMLRYDQATVIAWDHSHSGLLPDSALGDLWTITLRGRCTRDRWSSFGIAVFPAR